MRRWMAMGALVLAVSVVAAFAPARADVPERTPIVFVCTGTAGYQQTQYGLRWKAKRMVVPVGPPACVAYARDTAKPLAVPNPPPQVDPTDPAEAFDRMYQWAYYTQDDLQTSSPKTMGDLYLTGVGDFACGAGTLADDGDNYQYSNTLWTYHGSDPVLWGLDWTATFSNGVGQITGTAVGPGGGWPWLPARHERTLSGTIVVDDGAAYGQCNDSAGASRFVAVLTLS